MRYRKKIISILVVLTMLLSLWTENSISYAEDPYTYKSNHDGTHSVYEITAEGEMIIVESNGMCKYGEDGTCMYCGYFKDEAGGDGHRHDYSIYTDNGDGNHMVNCSGCDSYYLDAHYEFDDNGLCIHCGGKSKNWNPGDSGDVEIYDYVYESNHDGTHRVLYKENEQVVVKDENAKCEYDEFNKCRYCYYEKREEEHNHNYIVYSDNGDGTHKVGCSDCTSYYIEEHNEFYDNGLCVHCGGKAENGNQGGSDANDPYTYKSNHDGTHYVYEITAEGEMIIVESNAMCKYSEDGTCMYCGYFKDEAGGDGHRHDYSIYTDNGDGSHMVNCSGCDSYYIDAHYEFDDNGLCIHCGGKSENGNPGETDKESYIYFPNFDGTHEISCIIDGKETIVAERVPCDYDENKKCKYCDYILEDKPVEPEPTEDPEPTKEPKPTREPEPTKQPEPTKEPEPTKQPEPTKEPEPTKQPEPTKEPEPTEAPAPVHTHQLTYVDAGNGLHTVKCADCSETYTEIHTYDANGVCTSCGAVKEVIAEHVHQYESIDNEDGTHTISCTDCEYTITEEHAYDEKGICKVCEADLYGSIQDAEVEITEVINVKKGIELTWDEVPDVEGYHVYRKKGTEKWKKVKSVSGNTWIDTKASSNGEKYQYKIVAYRGKVESEESDVATMFRMIKKNLAVAKNKKGKKMRLKWQVNSKGNGYLIQYSLDKDFDSIKKKQVSRAKKKEVVISGLKKGKTYYVRIRSYKKVGKKMYYSDWSDTKTVKIAK